MIAVQTGRGSTVCACVSSEGGCHSVGMHSNELQAPRVWQWLPRHLASRWHTLTHSRYGCRYTHCSAANINFLECSSREQHSEEDKEHCVSFSFLHMTNNHKENGIWCRCKQWRWRRTVALRWHKIWKMQSSEGGSLTLSSRWNSGHKPFYCTSVMWCIPDRIFNEGKKL